MQSDNFRVGVSVDLVSTELLALIQGLSFWEVNGHRLKIFPIYAGTEAIIRDLSAGGRFDWLIGSFVGGDWLQAASSKLSLINLNTLSHIEGISNCEVDWYSVGRTARDALLDQQVEAMAFLGPRGQYSARLMQAGLADGEEDSLDIVPFKPIMIKDWLKALSGSTGLFCSSPALAVGVCRIAKQVGLAIPEQLALLTTGDSTISSIQAGIELATIRLPYEKIGWAIAHSILTGSESIELSSVREELKTGSSLVRKKGINMPFEGLLNSLSERLEESLTVDSLAREARMSRRAFEIEFRRCLGKSPYQYLIHLRMKQASQLLRETSLSVASIGQRCGYPEIYCFSAAFKKIFNSSPDHWRKSIRSVS